MSAFIRGGLATAAITCIAAGVLAPGSAMATSGRHHDHNCPSRYYNSAGNNDRSDDGCDYRNYTHSEKNGDNAPNSYDYGRAHSRDGGPVQSFIDGM
jgi:hypothetical protein